MRVGDDPASVSYVKKKEKTAAEIGIARRVLLPPATISPDELFALIDQLNADPAVDGILVQSPLPGAPRRNRRFPPHRPRQGRRWPRHHQSRQDRAGRRLGLCVAARRPASWSCSTRSGVKLAGRHVVVLGRSLLVGKPVALLALQKKAGANATVTVCHSQTTGLPALARQADVLIAAIGRAEFVTADMVKPGAVVIDVGINRVADATRKNRLPPRRRRAFRLRRPARRQDHARARRRRTDDGRDADEEHPQGVPAAASRLTAPHGNLATGANLNFLSSQHAAPKILVVDDQPINVQLLKRKLEREGMQVAAAYSGQEALDLVEQDKPDLILLDVMMPDMDGIEVCQRLQADEETRSIPIIFVTARSSKEGKLEGLGVGAVDYITKPIDLDETLARVQTQLRFAAINREIIDLQRRLTEARRAATIGAVTQGIAHNLNNLLGVVIGYLDLIKAYHDKPELVKKNVQNVEEAVQRIVSIIRQLSSLVVKTRLPVTKVSLQHILEGGVQRYADGIQDHPARHPQQSARRPHRSKPMSRCSRRCCPRSSSTPGRPTPTTSPPEKRPITISTELVDRDEDGKFVQIRVEDQGRGIDPEIRDQMFEPFISTKHTVGVGMGLTVARHAMRNMGGEVTMEDRPGGGAVAVLLHPLVRNGARRRADELSRQRIPSACPHSPSSAPAAWPRPWSADCSPGRRPPPPKSPASAARTTPPQVLARRTGITAQPTSPRCWPRPTPWCWPASPSNSPASIRASPSSPPAGSSSRSLPANASPASPRPFPRARNLVRAMPNTPGQIGAGITGWCALQPLERRRPPPGRHRARRAGARRSNWRRNTWTPSPPSAAAARPSS